MISMDLDRKMYENSVVSFSWKIIHFVGCIHRGCPCYHDAYWEVPIYHWYILGFCVSHLSFLQHKNYWCFPWCHNSLFSLYLWYATLPPNFQPNIHTSFQISRSSHVMYNQPNIHISYQNFRTQILLKVSTQSRHQNYFPPNPF